MIELTPAQRRELRARAHHLHPVVSIADKGLTTAVLGEIQRSLHAHELIKVRVHGGERQVREALLQEICEALDAAPVQHIGNILVVWRERRDEDRPAVEAPAKAAAARPGTAKSASAFAAAARRAALAKAAADKRRFAARKPGGTKRPLRGT